jgi:putative intracellular protease/amidase
MASQKTVGVLLFEGFELLDVFGPLEAWGMHAAAGGACTIVTAAEKAGAVKSAQGRARLPTTRSLIVREST